MSLRLRQIRLVAYQLEPVIEPVNGWRQTVSIRYYSSKEKDKTLKF
jgi:hypothetical protein